MTQQPTKFYSGRQESMISEQLNWKLVSGSGARMHPGDVVSDQWLGECKTHQYFPSDVQFNAATWNKLCNEAMSQFKSPAYFSDDGSQSIFNTWVMFSGQRFTKSRKLLKFPVKFKKNIKESSENLYTYLRSASLSESTQFDGFELEFEGKNVIICPLSVFIEEFKQEC